MEKPEGLRLDVGAELGATPDFRFACLKSDSVAVTNAPHPERTSAIRVYLPCGVQRDLPPRARLRPTCRGNCSV